MLTRIIVILVFSAIAESFTLEPVDFVEFKDFDGVRSYPVLKVSFKPKNSRKNVKTKGELRANKLTKGEKSENLKSEHVDNVREFVPMSRNDIKRLKKLSFHGRSSTMSGGPNATANSISRNSPTQLEYLQRKYSLQQQANARKMTERKTAESREIGSQSNDVGSQSGETETQSREVGVPSYEAVTRRRENPTKMPNKNREIPTKFSSKTFSNNDKGFLPLMRPSPINVHPANPPSFQTVRNYVDYLKMRQKQFFAELERDEKPAASQKASTEVDYFVKRERELADEQRPKADAQMEHRSNADIEIEDVRDGGHPDSREYDRENENEGEEESRRHDQFVPFRMYAQVRHVEAENHEPRPRSSHPQPKEKVTLEKKNVYYKEEGYEEKDYDHGAEKISSKYRAKRSVDELQVAPEDLPVALAFIKKSELPKLTGEKLLKHLDELLKNSSIFLPDEDDVVVETKSRRTLPDTIYGTTKNYKSHKYPYYDLPGSTLDQMSAFRYSENLKNFPSTKQSLYSFKNVIDCQEIEPEVDPVPDDIEEEGKSTKFNKSPQRLNNLGDKIKCYKDKYFGKDPFDNPLFKEQYVSASIPIPLKESSFIPHQANPLITVYDDVISNIRAAFAEEVKKKKEKELLEQAKRGPSKPTAKNPPTTTSAPDPIPAGNSVAKTTRPELKVVNLTSAKAVSRLPLFDISNYYPKFNYPLSEETPSTPYPIRNDFEMDFIDIPVNDKSFKNKSTNREISSQSLNVGEAVITNLRPPNLSQEKRRRRNPVLPKTIQITRIHSPSHYFQPPLGQEKIKFKLL